MCKTHLKSRVEFLRTILRKILFSTCELSFINLNLKLRFNALQLTGVFSTLNDISVTKVLNGSDFFMVNRSLFGKKIHILARYQDFYFVLFYTEF